LHLIYYDFLLSHKLEAHEEQTYLAKVQDFQGECNENGEASDVPDNDSGNSVC